MRIGFTLIELLIVIAVLGVLAAGVLIAINPAEQLARARDASRKTTVGQLNKAAQAHYTSLGVYPTGDATWVTQLVNAGEIKSVPGSTTYSLSGTAACGMNVQSGWCYVTNPNRNEALVYARLESGSEKAKCATGNPYFLWSSVDGRAGVVCSAADPVGSGYTYQ